ncbi:MAG: YCF48-related protein [Patescibacteria group bacterium]
MKTKKIILIGLMILSAILLTGQGCAKQKKVVKGLSDGGLWVSYDKGETWQQKVAMPTLAGLKQLNELNLNFLIFDPQDSQTLYWGAAESGLYVSYDGANSWQEVSKLPKTYINDLVVDPKAKNIIYVAINNRIYKSTDCSRNWTNIYIDIPGVAVNALAVDPLNSKRIIAGLADGRLIESEDGGINWRISSDLKTNIKDIFFNPKEPNIVYLATQTSGLYRSTDSGKNWNKIEELDKIPGASVFYYAFFDETRKDALFILTDAGFLRSDEGATNWQTYRLLTQPGRVKIWSFTANPKNPNEIYYATETTFYKSTNGGQTWITKNLPTSRKPIYLTTNPDNPNILYLGTYQPPSK